MTKPAAQRQKEYRSRKKLSGSEPVSLILPRELVSKMRTIATSDGITLSEALMKLVTSNRRKGKNTRNLWSP